MCNSNVTGYPVFSLAKSGSHVRVGPCVMRGPPGVSDGLGCLRTLTSLMVLVEVYKLSTVPGEGLALVAVTVITEHWLWPGDFRATRWSDLAEGTRQVQCLLPDGSVGSRAGMLGDVQRALTWLPEIIPLPPSVGLMMGMGRECTPSALAQGFESRASRTPPVGTPHSVVMISNSVTKVGNRYAGCLANSMAAENRFLFLDCSEQLCPALGLRRHCVRTGKNYPCKCQLGQKMRLRFIYEDSEKNCQ